MVIIDQNMIDAALKRLDIKPGDYYLSFTPGIVHMYWCETVEGARKHIEDCTLCCDVLIADTWHPVEYLHTDTFPLHLNQHYVQMRYILEVA